MADNFKNCTIGESFELSAGQPQPICTGDPYDTTNCICHPGSQIRYVMQTFGGKKRTTINHRATTQLLESNDFIGLNADAEYESASYQGTQYVTKDGEVVFTGREQKRVEYIGESEVPGVSDFVI